MGEKDGSKLAMYARSSLRRGRVVRRPLARGGADSVCAGPPPAARRASTRATHVLARQPFIGDASDVAEIGSGGGRVAVRVAPRCASYACFDISLEMLKKARDALSELSNVRFCHMMAPSVSERHFAAYDFGEPSPSAAAPTYRASPHHMPPSGVLRLHGAHGPAHHVALFWYHPPHAQAGRESVRVHSQPAGARGLGQVCPRRVRRYWPRTNPDTPAPQVLQAEQVHGGRILLSVPSGPRAGSLLPSPRPSPPPQSYLPTWCAIWLRTPACE